MRMSLWFSARTTVKSGIDGPVAPARARSLTLTLFLPSASPPGLIILAKLSWSSRESARPPESAPGIRAASIPALIANAAASATGAKPPSTRT